MAPADTPVTTDIPQDVIKPEQLEHGDDRVKRLVTRARKMMEKDIPILIYGETGSGKEILVRSLHYHSSRADRPLVAVNCAAIPSELAESQLFGYEKGAFTGAHSKGYIGLIRQADGGTLFLDEIGEMPLMLQSRLLRVLQQREVTPLGSTESYPVDVKLVSATNRSLQADIADGHFRQDLYYRIAGLNVELPALRERNDIRPLIRFVHQRLRETEPGPELSDSLLDLLARHPWPGHMRQLVHALKVSMAMADGEPVEEDHLPDDFFADAPQPTSPAAEPLSERLPRLYRANGGNVSRTAKAAGVSRNTVYKYVR
jgi:transcriptional regulator of acetoin/glycerol metabolism